MGHFSRTSRQSNIDTNSICLSPPVPRTQALKIPRRLRATCKDVEVKCQRRRCRCCRPPPHTRTCLKALERHQMPKQQHPFLLLLPAPIQPYQPPYLLSRAFAAGDLSRAGGTCHWPGGGQDGVECVSSQPLLEALQQGTSTASHRGSSRRCGAPQWLLFLFCLIYLDISTRYRHNDHLPQRYHQ